MTFTFDSLPTWQHEILLRMLETEFPGRELIASQLLTACFEIIDQNGSLKVSPNIQNQAPIERTVPVEAESNDVDEVPIQVLLFTRNGVAYMVEVLRLDGNPVKSLPPPDKFKIQAIPIRKRR